MKKINEYKLFTYQWAILLSLFFVQGINAQDAPLENSKGGFVEFNYSYDVEDFTVLTINVLSRFDYGFHYFALTNYASPFQDKESINESQSFFSEQNLRWKVPKIPFDLTLQWNLRGGEENDRFRLGTRWIANATPGINEFLKSIGLFYSLNFHAYQFDYEDAYVFQMEHVYKLAPFGDVIYLAGFADHFMVGEGASDNALITEHQLGIQVYEGLYAISEFRRISKRSDSNSLGFGLEYKMKW